MAWGRKGGGREKETRREEKRERKKGEREGGMGWVGVIEQEGSNEGRKKEGRETGKRERKSIILNCILHVTDVVVWMRMTPLGS